MSAWYNPYCIYGLSADATPETSMIFNDLYAFSLINQLRLILLSLNISVGIVRMEIHHWTNTKTFPILVAEGYIWYQAAVSWWRV